jgi:hypothetical protein
MNIRAELDTVSWILGKRTADIRLSAYVLTVSCAPNVEKVNSSDGESEAGL